MFSILLPYMWKVQQCVGFCKDDVNTGLTEHVAVDPGHNCWSPLRDHRSGGTGGTGGTGSVKGVWSRQRRRRSEEGIQHHGQRHQSPVGWGRGASTFSVSHAASSHFLGGNAASLNLLDTCKVEGGRTQRQNLCRHSNAYKNHVGLLSDCNRMNAESAEGERKNSRGKKARGCARRARKKMLKRRKTCNSKGR